MSQSQEVFMKQESYQINDQEEIDSLANMEEYQGEDEAARKRNCLRIPEKKKLDLAIFCREFEMSNKRLPRRKDVVKTFP